MGKTRVKLGQNFVKLEKLKAAEFPEKYGSF